MSKKSKYGLSILCILVAILIFFSFLFENSQKNSITVTTISGDEKELDNLNLVNTDMMNRLAYAKNDTKSIKSESFLISSKGPEKLNLSRTKDGSIYLSNKTKSYRPISYNFYSTLGDCYIESNNGNPAINISKQSLKPYNRNYKHDLFEFELKKDSNLYNLVKKDDIRTVYNLDHNNKNYCIIVVDNESEFRDKQDKDRDKGIDTEKKKYRYDAKIFLLEMNYENKSYKEISSSTVSSDFSEIPSFGYISAFDKIIISVENNYKGKYFLFDTESGTVNSQNIEVLPKSDEDNRELTILSIVESNFPYFDKRENKLNIIHSDIKNENIIIYKYVLENNQLKFSEKVDTKIPVTNDTYTLSKDNQVKKININEAYQEKNRSQDPYMISMTSEVPYHYLLLNNEDSNKIIFFKIVNIDIYKNMSSKSTENVNYGYHNLGSNPALEINIYDKSNNKLLYQGLLNGNIRSNPFDFVLCDVDKSNI